MLYYFNTLKIFIKNEQKTMARSLLYPNVDAKKRIGS
jgi:hypothetical protein